MISLQIYSFFSYITTILLFFLIVISCFVFRLFKKRPHLLYVNTLHIFLFLSHFSVVRVLASSLFPLLALHLICASPFSLISPRPSPQLPLASLNFPYFLIPFLYSVSCILLPLIFHLFLKKVLKIFGGEFKSVYLCTRFRGRHVEKLLGSVGKMSSLTDCEQRRTSLPCGAHRCAHSHSEGSKYKVMFIPLPPFHDIII